jgi:uncharacterized protein (DUF927 family)
VNRAAALKGLAEVDVSDQRRLHRVLIAVATTLRGEDARVWQSTRAAVTATLRKKKTPMKMISQLLNSFFGHSASASAPPSNQEQASGQADAPGAEPPGTADWAKAVRFPFRLTADGVEYVNEDDEGNIDWSPLCSRLEVRALTRTSESEAWGRFLKWRDPDQHEHYWAMPAELLAGNGTQIRAVLLDGGLIVMSGVNAARRLNEYLATTRPTARVRCVSRCGWHDSTYVLGDTTFPAATDAQSERIILQTMQAVDLSARSAGTLEDWQESVARYCIGNSRLAFSVYCSFAAPLLGLTGDESGGFHHYGASSIGKTTMLRVAGSVWGGGGENGWLRTWRATANGLESVAAAHCDALLCLDELSQASPREVGDVVYMLANQTGKRRAKGDGTARHAQTWRTLWLSSGEVTMAMKMREGGLRSRAGQDVRLVEVPADADAGLGVFENLHGFETGAALVQHLRTATQRAYGVAIRQFLTRLAERPAELAADAAEIRQRLIAEYCPADADGQVQRVADRFGLVAAAGELACWFRILPWEQGESRDAAEVCFKAWLAARGGVGPAELVAGIEQVRLFLAQHGASRFALTGTDNVRDRAGFVRCREPQRSMGIGMDSRPAPQSPVTEYLVLPAVWRAEVCAGHDPRAIAQALADAGHLRKDRDGKSQARRRVHGIRGTRRYYVILPTILAEKNDEHGDDSHA